MKYGNCLIGVLCIAVKHDFQGKFIVIKSKRQFVPHFMWLSHDGCAYDYSVYYDILPWPFCYVLYKGQYAKLNKAKTMKYLKSYNKRGNLNSQWERLDDSKQD